MSTPQEYWDACVIKMWRRNGTIGDAMSMFHSLTGGYIRDLGLKRLPPLSLTKTKSVKIFVSYYLPKINDWLWDKPPERDVELLRKLSASKYDTLDKAYRTNMDRELAREKQRNRTNKKRMAMNSLSTSNRNQATDWGVTKGGRIGRKR